MKLTPGAVWQVKGSSSYSIFGFGVCRLWVHASVSCRFHAVPLKTNRTPTRRNNRIGVVFSETPRREDARWGVTNERPGRRAVPRATRRLVRDVDEREVQFRVRRGREWGHSGEGHRSDSSQRIWENPWRRKRAAALKNSNKTQSRLSCCRRPSLYPAFTPHRARG